MPAAAPHSPVAGIRRPRLVSRCGADAPPLAVVVAPAGFGKTTLLREWSARDPRPFAWITLSRRAQRRRRAAARRRRGGRRRARRTRRTAAIVLVLDDVHVPAQRRRARDRWRRSPPSCPPTLRSRWRRAASCRCPSRGCAPRASSPSCAQGELAMTRPKPRRCCAAPGCGSHATTSMRCSTPPRAGPRRSRSPRARWRDQPAPGPAAARFGGGDRDHGGLPARRGPRRAVDGRAARSSARSAVLDVLTAPGLRPRARAPGSAAVHRRAWRVPASRWWRSTARASATGTIAC